MYACVCVCVCLCECVCMRARTDKKRKIKCTSHSYIAVSYYSSITSFGPFHVILSYLDGQSLFLSLSFVPFFFIIMQPPPSFSPFPHLTPTSPPHHPHPPPFSPYTHLPTSSFLPPYLHCTLADANSHRSSICS